MPVYRLANPKRKKDDSIIVRCNCQISEHELTIYPWEEIADTEMGYSLSFCLLTHNNIFKRIWLAVKYVFNVHRQIGYFDEIIITDSDFREIFAFFEKHRKDIK